MFNWKVTFDHYVCFVCDNLDITEDSAVAASLHQKQPHRAVAPPHAAAAQRG